MSQINTNTIANELGTGGPDFVGMPSVGGDPVVESGSNTDGEWTRFADGTQICTASKEHPSIAVNTGYGTLYISAELGALIFPLAFLSAPSVSYSFERVAQSFQSSFVVFRKPTITGVDGYWYSSPLSNSSVAMALTYQAVGRWK